MWKPIETPGEWLVFLQRKDIKGLPIMEARKRYMQEQLLFEAYENNLNTVNTVNSTTAAPASAAAGGGGGLRKFKYPAEFKLSNGVDDDKRGVYTRVAISDLKRYWVDNFTNVRGGGFSVPPPSIPSNIGSDFFFIKHLHRLGMTRANIVTWGSLGSGRQRGQWTYSEYIDTTNTCYTQFDRNDKWVTIGFGSTNLSTPAGKFSINDVVDDGGKIPVCDIQRNTYVLEENKIPPPPAGSLIVTGATSSDTGYVGNYIKDPSSGTGQDAIYIREDDAMKIYYNTTCAMWRIDNTGVFKLACGVWTGNPTGDSPLGTYQLSAVKAPASGTYTVTQN
jgi:hypothetical protein